MAMVIEQAGGGATTGMFNGDFTRLLDLLPGEIHEKCPIVVGCLRDIDRCASGSTFFFSITSSLIL